MDRVWRLQVEVAAHAYPVLVGPKLLSRLPTWVPREASSYFLVADSRVFDLYGRAVLQALRTAGAGRLVVVFGAGGDRDRGKRAPMGAAVGELADVAVVTSDNPRSEEPSAIAEAVADGVRSAGGEPVVELDRRRAIALALEMARPGDVVLIAGKGHEREQLIGDRRIPFDDRQVVLELAGGVPCA